MATFSRPHQFRTLLSRLRGPRRFVQVLAGPRQSGKTTLATQAMRALEVPSHYASADEPSLRDRSWIGAQWDIARIQSSAAKRGSVLLILDEVQKIPGWSEVVKRLWDEDTRARRPVKVLLLGSSPLMMQSGLTESLAGRFELVPVPHWSFAEMREAFGWDLDRFLYFGGYPGAASLVRHQQRWRRYVIDSLIETAVSRDILLLTRVDKPALLRQLFQLGCDFSGQVLSYNKMLGQLGDAGNTTTLAHYLQLLAGAGLIAGIPKFSNRAVRRRGSSPKLQVLNTALMTATSSIGFAATRKDRELWGRVVESAVGAHLLNSVVGTTTEVFYWRDRGLEVDFVIRRGKTLVALEVKSGRRPAARRGLDAFSRAFKPSRRLLVGADGIPLEEFLSSPLTRFYA